MAAKKKTDTEVVVVDMTQGRASFALLGVSPMIFNSMSQKAWISLLGPEATSRKSKADRALAFKHVPMEEFRNSVYRNLEDDKPTRLRFPAPAFKGAMMTAALDMKGVAKTEIGRLTWIEGYSVNIWGIPEMMMSVVRSADINKTPDIRTRAILREWCCIITVAFVQPKLTAKTVSQLLAGAGMTVGIGDFRQERGKGNYGQFCLVDNNNADLKRLQKTAGRVEQDAALENPAYYDDETEQMYLWHLENVIQAKSSGVTLEAAE